MAALTQRLVEMEQRAAARELEMTTRMNATVGAMRQEVLEARAIQANTAQAPYRMEATVDTRTLGKPDHFNGGDKDWGDWPIVFRSYAAAVSNVLGTWMPWSEAQDVIVMNEALGSQEAIGASRQLYYILIMLTRHGALDIVVNAGQGNGLEAWRKLCIRYEPKSRMKHTHILAELIHWDFGGQVTVKLEAFDRRVNDYEKLSKEALTDNVKIGILLANLPKGAIRQHMLFNTEKVVTWKGTRDELEQIRLAVDATAQGHQPMDIGYVGSGGKGGGKGGNKSGGGGGKGGECNRCGRPNHYAKDCFAKKHANGTDLAPKAPGGGKNGQPKGGNNKPSKGGGKGGGKGGANPAQGKTCHNCGKANHFAKDCRSPKKSVNGLEEEQWNDETAQEPEGERDLQGLFLCALEKDNVRHQQVRRIVFGIDSGAATTVVPPEACPDFPTVENELSKNGYSYKTAAKGVSIKDEGTRKLVGTVMGKMRGVTTHVCQVGKPLMSVAEMIDQNHRIVFDSAGSYAENKDTGDIVEFERRNNVFEITLEVQPYAKVKNLMDRCAHITALENPTKASHFVRQVEQ